MTVVCVLALLGAVLASGGCVSSEVRAQCPNWSLWSGCGVGGTRNALTIGMTTNQVLTTWGSPRTINETVTAAGTSQEWIYETGPRLLFEDGVLRAIQRTVRRP